MEPSAAGRPSERRNALTCQRRLVHHDLRVGGARQPWGEVTKHHGHAEVLASRHRVIVYSNPRDKHVRPLCGGEHPLAGRVAHFTKRTVREVQELPGFAVREQPLSFAVTATSCPAARSAWPRATNGWTSPRLPTMAIATRTACPPSLVTTRWEQPQVMLRRQMTD
jgi:hypothetical protein